MNDTEARPETALKTRKPHECNNCPRRWSGSNMAHCGACHETFGGVGSFDKHRAGTKDKTRRLGECAPPADLDLTLNAHGTWVAPSDGIDFAAIHGKAVQA